MAEAFYTHLTGTSDASSAGTEVEVPGESLAERRQRRGGTDVIEVMAEEGIDVAGARKVQLTQAMLADYDRIISMTQKEHTPDWLSTHPNYIYWDVDDPGGQDYAKTKVARDEIKKRVQQLLIDLKA